MSSQVWLYTHQSEAAVRVVQRARDEGGIELIVVGPKRQNEMHTFRTLAEARAFREWVESQLVANGFALLLERPVGARATGRRIRWSARTTAPHRCPHCGSTNADEARRSSESTIYRCLHCWKLFTDAPP